MKKYTLIKTYPGSPELGYILEPSLHTQLNPTEYVIGFDLLTPSKHPEFWEEVVEKEYEILTLKRLDDNSVACIKDCKIVNIFIKNMPGNQLAIHSVKRLSDGEIFTIGDTVSLNERWGKNDCKIKSFRVKNNSLDFEIIQGNASGWYGEFLNQSLNQWSKIKPSLFTNEQRSEIEEIIKNIIK